MASALLLGQIKNRGRPPLSLLYRRAYIDDDDDDDDDDGSSICLFLAAAFFGFKLSCKLPDS